MVEYEDKQIKYIYTCNFGSYDVFESGDVNYYEGIKFVYFHDNPSQTFAQNLIDNGWIGQFIDLKKKNAAVLNRDIKFHPWNFLPTDLTESIYIDANISVTSCPAIVFEEFSKFTVGFFRHWSRDTFTEEFLECARAGHFFLPSNLNLLAQAFVDSAVQLLPECNLIYMKNKCSARKFAASWWNKYLRGPRRDQLSVKSALIESGVDFFISPINEQRSRQWCFRTNGMHRSGNLKLKQRIIGKINRIFL